MPNKILAVTRPLGKGEDTAEFIQSLGWTPLIVHSVEISPRKESEIYSDLNSVQSQEADSYVFMSPEGVHLIIQGLKKYHENMAMKFFSGSRVIAVGPATRNALIDEKFLGVEIPKEYSSIGIATLLGDSTLQNKRIVLFRSLDANDTLQKLLESQGAIVTTIPVYSSNTANDTSTVESLITGLRKGHVGAVLFTSSRSVSNFFDIAEKIIGSEELRALLTTCIVGAIGPITGNTLTNYNVKVNVLAGKAVINESIRSLIATWESTHRAVSLDAVSA